MNVYPDEKEFKITIDYYQKLNSAFLPTEEFCRSNFPELDFCFPVPACVVLPGLDPKPVVDMIKRQMFTTKDVVFVVARDPKSQLSMTLMHDIISYVLHTFYTGKVPMWCGRFLSAFFVLNGCVGFLTSDLDEKSMVDWIKMAIAPQITCLVCNEQYRYDGSMCIRCKETMCHTCVRKNELCPLCKFPLVIKCNKALTNVWKQMLLASLTYTKDGELPSLLFAVGSSDSKLLCKNS